MFSRKKHSFSALRVIIFSILILVVWAIAFTVYQHQVFTQSQLDKPDMLAYSLEGEGDVLVVFEAGMLESGITNFEQMATQVRQKHSTLRYDRYGIGQSKSPQKIQNATVIVNQLHDLIESKKPDTAIILVGHSLGGLYARHYVNLYPENVIGVVLVDSVHEWQFELLSKPSFCQKYYSDIALSSLGLQGLMGKPQERNVFRYVSKCNEVRALDLSVQELELSQRQVNMPFIIVSADRNPQNEAYYHFWYPLQRLQGTYSTKPFHVVVANATHSSLIQKKEHQQYIVEAIDFIAAQR